MRTAEAYATLRAIDRPAIETREAALVLGTSQTATSRTLGALADTGLIRRVRHGLWALDPDVRPRTLAHYLTAPYPAYASSWTALAVHGMIEQLPAAVHAVSLDRSKTIRTAYGTFEVHHIAPELFDGFDGDPDTGYLAGPEKALFDSVYLRAPRGGRVRFPELSPPADFDHSLLDTWVQRVATPRLRTIVSRELANALGAGG